MPVLAWKASQPTPLCCMRSLISAERRTRVLLEPPVVPIARWGLETTQRGDRVEPRPVVHPIARFWGAALETTVRRASRPVIPSPAWGRDDTSCLVWSWLAACPQISSIIPTELLMTIIIVIVMNCLFYY